MARLGDLTNVKTGTLDANAASPDGQYPFFTCSKETLKIGSYHYNCECVLVAGNGDLNVKYYNGKFDAYQRTYIIESRNKNDLFVPYLFYFLDSYLEILRGQSIGGVIKYIKLGNLTEADIPLPELNVQKEIVKRLEKLDNLISLRKQQLVKLDELVKARFVEMFGDPEINPYGWEKVTVNDVCSSIIRGPFGSALKKEYFVPRSVTTYKVYEQKHAIQKSDTIGAYYITPEKFEELRRFECKAGDILMSCSGTMGELYQLPVGCERGIINQALCKFTLNSRILPITFLTYMQQTIGNLEVKGSGIKNIAAVSYVKALPINLPPIDMQQRFSDYISEIYNLKLTIQHSLDKLEMLEKLLTQKYFG